MTQGARITVPWGLSETLALELPEQWKAIGKLELALI